jgi:hypothetical protein
MSSDKRATVNLTMPVYKIVKKRAETCFVCKRILESMDEKRNLRDWPPGSGGEGRPVELPIEGQHAHVLKEIS